MPLASRDVAGAKGWGWGLPSSGLLAALVGLSLLLLVRSSLPASGWGVALQAGRTGAATTALTAATGGAACTGRPTLMGYVPSNWEERWCVRCGNWVLGGPPASSSSTPPALPRSRARRRVAATPELVAAPGSICGLVAAQPALVETWLTGVKLQSAALLGDSQRAAGGARRLGAEWVQPPPHDLYPPTTFSRFLYRDDCGATIAAPIEPLVGHFRWAAWMGEARSAGNVQLHPRPRRPPATRSQAPVGPLLPAQEPHRRHRVQVRSSSGAVVPTGASAVLALQPPSKRHFHRCAGITCCCRA